jgi:HlyD family secretion protein
MKNIIKKKFILVTVASILVIATAALLLDSKITKSVKYQFVSLTKGTIESTISSTGTLNPVTEITVGTQVSGTIEKVFVDFNDRVSKGQIIAVLDSAVLRMSVDDARSVLLKAEAEFEEAQANYDRSKKLSERNLISDSDFQSVKTSLKSAQASLISAETGLKRAQQNLNYAIIRSPINGTVTARSVEAGQTVAASFATPTLFTIAQDLSKMEIKASVDESDIGQIEMGQTAGFTVQAYPEKTFSGYVKQIRLQPTTTSNVVNYTVVVSAENKENHLLPGMTATVEFIIKRKTDVLMVQNAALRFQPEQKEIADAQQRMQVSMPPALPDSLKTKTQQVPPPTSTGEEWKRLWYLNKDGKLVFAPVRIGISDAVNTEIIGDHFSEGMKIIVGIETESTRMSSSKSNSSSGGPPPPMM